MDDSRIQVAKDELQAAMLELDELNPNMGRVQALLDDSRCGLVDVVESCVGMQPRADVNQLDSARVYINRCISLINSRQPQEWVIPAMQQFVGGAIDHLTVVLSGNVVPLHRTRPTTPGGGAA